jgi:hypothetical protein
MTLTDGSRHGTMTVRQLSAAWDDLAKLLRAGGPAPLRPPRGSGALAQQRWRAASRARKSFLSEYALVLEIGPRGGRLHAHVVLTGRYIPQRRLSAWARRCGFGAVVDIRLVNPSDAGKVAHYLASYAVKAGKDVALMKGRARKRLRPLRTSRGWYPGGLRQVEADLGIRGKGGTDPGPWVLLTHDAKGVLTAVKTL